MSLDSNFVLWPFSIFGAEDKESEQNPENETPPEKPNPKVAQPNSPEDDEDDDDPYEGLSAKELRRIARDNERRAKDAEKERDSAKSTLTAKEREKLDKEQRQELEINDLKGTLSNLRAALAKQAIINGIICESKFEWHNPEVVAQQLNSEIVKVGDDGKVEGLAKELARVAKDHDYLLKTKGKQQDSQQQGPTGFQPGQGGANQGGSNQPNAAELAKTFPALVSRI